jgi:hypothetical protein
VLSYMASNNITGVRGNHDQKVIEWRAWIEWIHKLDGGSGAIWLDNLEQQWQEAYVAKGFDEYKWIKKHKKGNRKWWGKIPKGWKLFSDHYRVAR